MNAFKIVFSYIDTIHNKRQKKRKKEIERSYYIYIDKNSDFCMLIIRLQQNE